MSKDEAKHLLPGFDTALESLRGDVLLMGSLVRRNLVNVKLGFKEREDEHCAAVIADDDEIDVLEKQVDRQGTDILVRFQPMTFDLRRVLATIKLGAHLERFSNQTVTIARRVRKLNEDSPLEESEVVLEIFDQMENLLKEALEAFAHAHSARAEEIRVKMEPLAEKARELDDQFTDIIEDRTPQVRAYLNLIAIAQGLERCAYGIENIAEEAIYVAEAKDVRHEGNRYEEV
jgi:phosphate transport system protein